MSDSDNSTAVDCGIPRYTVQRQVNHSDQLKALAQDQPERVNWAESLLGIPKLWQETMGEGVKVAVLDTGVDPDHPDLQEAIEINKDFTGDGIEDKNGHGTHTAGVIGARLNNVGFVGVAPKCRLLIGKVLGNDGYGNLDWTAQGIDWAVAQGAHIISMSLGGSASTDGLYRSIHTALAKGVCIICAAGNEGSLFQNAIGFPGRYGSVITVAAHDRNGNRSGFSSRGGELDVMAPGSDIWSTYKDGGYAELSGTSMATPFVAGLSALVISKHIKAETSKTPINNNSDLRDHLLWMTTHPGYHDNQTGYGPLQPFQYFGGKIPV